MAATPIPRNVAVFEPAEIASVTGATTEVAPTGATVGVTTDSRVVEPGNLFVALRGERHDGHAHIAMACEEGARAVLVERPVEVPPGVGVFRVADTLEGLGALARFHRERSDVPVVAVTGSVGKTTTKELIAAALRGAGRHPLSTRGNLNNRIGVPMTLLTLDASHDAAVVELGMSVPGEIARLTAMVRPTVGLVTSVEAVHTEGVGSLAGVRQEKGALLAGLGSAATAIWCDRYPALEAFAGEAGRRFSYGDREGASVRIVEWELLGEAGTRATLALPGRDAGLEVRTRLLGEAAVLNIAAALTAVHAVDPAGVESAAAALAEVEPTPHRMAPRALPSGPLVLDDVYNASPASVASALSTASALAARRGGRLICVLGDMLELGKDEADLHTAVGQRVAMAGAHSLIACGERMAQAGRGALTATMEAGRTSRTKVVLLRNVADAASCVRDVVRSSDVVLVKGSRGMRMERVVDALVEAET